MAVKNSDLEKTQKHNQNDSRNEKNNFGLGPEARVASGIGRDFGGLGVGWMGAGDFPAAKGR